VNDGTYGRAHHETQVERHTMELAEALSKWMERDREDTVSATYHLANRLSVISRALSAEAAALATISQREHNRRR